MSLCHPVLRHKKIVEGRALLADKFTWLVCLFPSLFRFSTLCLALFFFQSRGSDCSGARCLEWSAGTLLPTEEQSGSAFFQFSLVYSFCCSFFFQSRNLRVSTLSTNRKSREVVHFLRPEQRLALSLSHPFPEFFNFCCSFPSLFHFVTRSLHSSTCLLCLFALPLRSTVGIFIRKLLLFTVERSAYSKAKALECSEAPRVEPSAYSGAKLIERNPPTGGCFYLLCSLIKNLEEEDSPQRICTRCFEGGPLPPGS